MKNQETSIIKEVHEGEGWYQLSLEGGTGVGLKTKHGKVPQVGDRLTIHTVNGPFSQIRGMDLNGESVFYFTDEQLEENRKEWLRKNEEKKQREFEERKSQLDERYNYLPPVFRERIDRFRANNPRFRVDYEPYELYCCEQALVIAEALKTPKAVEEFRTKGYEEQRNAVPLLDDGHSGNTFGTAVALAYFYLQQPEAIPKIHGALSPLVGSEAYGDIAPK